MLSGEECEATAGWLGQRLSGWNWERVGGRLDNVAPVVQEYQQLGQITSAPSPSPDVQGRVPGHYLVIDRSILYNR